MGFQDMPEIVHKMASAKGGRVRKPKGLALLPEEKRKEIASMGGHANANKNHRPESEDVSDSSEASVNNEQVQEQVRDSHWAVPSGQEDTL